MPSSHIPIHDADFPNALNRDCHCVSLDAAALGNEIKTYLGQAGYYDALAVSHPHLFSSMAVFISRTDVERMRAIIDAVEQVVAVDGYRQRALAVTDSIARFDPVSPGAFMGYDFHLGAQGPKLIEINTNAGGALLNVVLARATRACCTDADHMAIGTPDTATLDDVFVDMLHREWQAQRGAAPLKTVAIVDDDPASQYLYPEFLLFEALFKRRGLEAVIADPTALTWRDGRLFLGDRPIDLVYNRLTDFSLSEPRHAALRAAYLHRAVALTPHPRAHALYADKRNLVSLSDQEFLTSLGVPEETVSTLRQGVPHALIVTPENADVFWNERRRWFFKPFGGFGGRAAYRGDKLTKRVFEEIARGGYIAQERVEPAERVQSHSDLPPFKFDLRCYVYQNEVQLLAARLYQGQTTNFRTPGGGFAPVIYPK